MLVMVGWRLQLDQNVGEMEGSSRFVISCSSAVIATRLSRGAQSECGRAGLRNCAV